MVAILVHSRWCLLAVLICFFLIISNARPLYMCLLVVCVSFWEKSVQILWHFLNWVIWVLSLLSRSPPLKTWFEDFHPLHRLPCHLSIYACLCVEVLRFDNFSAVFMIWEIITSFLKKHHYCMFPVFFLVIQICVFIFLSANIFELTVLCLIFKIWMRS